MNTRELTNEALHRRVDMGRSFILIYTVMSLANVLAVAFLGMQTKLISSISAPYYLVLMGKGMDNNFVEGPWTVTGSLTTGCVMFALLLLLVFYACWSISKKHMGWVVIALAFFVIDIAVLAAAFLFLYRGNVMLDLMDMMFHIWIVILLIRCVKAHKELCDRRDAELLKELD